MTEFPEIEWLRKWAVPAENAAMLEPLAATVNVFDAERAVRDAVERVRDSWAEAVWSSSAEVEAIRRQAIRECAEVCDRAGRTIASGSDARRMLLTLLDGEGSGDE